MPSTAFALACLACVSHGESLYGDDALRSERRGDSSRQVLGSLLLAAIPSLQLKMQNGHRSAGRHPTVSMDEVFAVGETFEDPTKLEFRDLLNFFGKVTVGLGPGMKPLDWDFEPTWEFDESQLSTVKVDITQGIAAKASETNPGRFEVSGIQKDSAADAAGIQLGDLIRGTTAMAVNRPCADADIDEIAIEASTKVQRCLFITDGQTPGRFVEALTSNFEEKGGPGYAVLVIERYDPFGRNAARAI